MKLHKTILSTLSLSMLIGSLTFSQIKTADAVSVNALSSAGKKIFTAIVDSIFNVTNVMVSAPKISVSYTLDNIILQF